MADEKNPDGTAAEPEVTTPADPTAEQTSTQEVPAKEAPPKEQQETPQYVTREELERHSAELLRRVKQSSSDRAREVDRRFDEIKASMETRQAPLSVEQQSVLRQQIEKQVDGPEQDGQAQSTGEQAIQSLNAFIGAVFADVGVAVTVNDPEFKALQDSIDRAWTVDGPQGLVMVQRAAIKAAEAKAARVTSQKNSAQARVVSGGGERTANPNSIANITDTDQLYEIGEKQRLEGKK